MTNNERFLLRYVCEGDLRNARMYAKFILESGTSKKDETFREELLELLDNKAKQTVEVPYNLQQFLKAENSESFPHERFLLRKNEAEIVEKVLSVYHAAEKLQDLNIEYLPALILHGKTGCGKTMLAQYIAHKAHLPFFYIKLSSLVSSYLGSTSNNISLVFDFIRKTPCVFCLDELDAIGMARGQRNDVAEMNRIVIALMQEMDKLPNNVIIIGTTNRFDRLDDALVRRFPLCYETKELSAEDGAELARKFFQYAQVEFSDWFDEWRRQHISDAIPAYSVVNACKEKLVQLITQEV